MMSSCCKTCCRRTGRDKETGCQASKSENALLNQTGRHQLAFVAELRGTPPRDDGGNDGTGNSVWMSYAVYRRQGTGVAKALSGSLESFRRGNKIGSKLAGHEDDCAQQQSGRIRLEQPPSCFVTRESSSRCEGARVLWPLAVAEASAPQPQRSSDSPDTDTAPHRPYAAAAA